VWEPLETDSNFQTQNSIVPKAFCEEIETKMVVHEMTMHSLEESITTQNMPTSSIVEIIINDKEYDKALDDGPSNPPNFEIDTNICEDKNDQLDICDNTHTHMNPTLLLSSPNHTIEEKLAYVKKYLCCLQLSLDPNICCSHNIDIDTNLSNYFERGKSASEFHNEFNDSLYVPLLSKLHDPSGYIVKFASSNSNYYERGGDKCPPYACNNNMNSSIGNMQGFASNFYNSIIYKMPMHRKKVRIKICWIYASWFILSSLKLLNFLIVLITPWDPGIIMEHFPRKK